MSPSDSPPNFNNRQTERTTNDSEGHPACGIDSSNSEMLKHSHLKLQRAVQKHFNLVLTAGNYPSVWNKGFTSPIFKSGDKYNPSNYRGICVNSNPSKLFCSIFNSRLIAYLTDHHILSRSQIGYSLHTLIQQHVHKKHTKMFACFVDLKKAFDTIWYNGLFFTTSTKWNWGGGGNQCCVKIGNKRTRKRKRNIRMLIRTIIAIV